MEQTHTKQEASTFEIDLGQLFQNLIRALRRLWLPVLLLTVACAGIALLLQNRSYVPSYKAYCSFSVRVINKSTLSETNSLYAVYYDQDLAEQLDTTFSYLLSSDLLTDDIRNYLGTDRINGRIEANCIKGSNIFVLTTYSSTPKDAADLLEAVLAVYEDAAQYVIGDMETETIEAPIVSDTPYNTPSRTKALAFGALIGFMLGMCSLGIYALLKRTVLAPAELERYINMPCLGVLPGGLTKRQLLASAADGTDSYEQGAFQESIRGIARKLEAVIEKKDIKVLLVSSTAPGEGKSTVSQQLAETFAYWDKTVILLDGDMRKPSLYRRYGIKGKQLSLEAVLSGNAPAETILLPQKGRPLTLAGNTELVENPTVCISSPAMKALIQAFSKQADLVIIDTPPCERIIDAELFQQYADGVVFVVQQDRIPISEIVSAAEDLCDSENKLLGFVLNGAEHIPQGYGKYGYGKYSYGRYGSYYGNYGSRYGKYSYHSSSSATPSHSER